MGDILHFTRDKVSPNTPPGEARRLILSHIEEGKRHSHSASVTTCNARPSSLSEKERILQWLDQIRNLVEQGRISEFLFVCKDLENKHFLTEVAIPKCSQSELFGFVGVLEALKLELTERAQLSPALMADGTVLDPYYEKESLQ